MLMAELGDSPSYWNLAKKELSKNDEIKIEVKKAEGKKCERCWKILEKKCQRENCPIN